MATTKASNMTAGSPPIAGGRSTDLRADRLSVDPAYQRPVNPRKVRTIINNFDPDLIGVLLISKRDDGTLVIMDGQQRWTAIIDMNWGDQKLPCHVYEGLSVADEARLFRGYNDSRTKPKPIDLHRAEVAEGGERAIAIEKQLAAHGLTLATGAGLNYVRSIGTLQDIYDGAGEQVLRLTLTVVQRAWGSESESFQSDTLKAIGMILARHRHALDMDRLIRVLHKLSPGSLVGRARVVKAELGSIQARVPAVVAQIIINEYNRRLPEEKRIVWDAERHARRYWVSDRPDVPAPRRQSAEQRRRLEQGGMQP